MARGDLRGRVGLITGATRHVGIGAAIARELADAGANVFLAFFRAYDRAQPWSVLPDEPQELMRELRSKNVEVEGVEIDLAGVNAAPMLVEQVVARFGALDILVNNACCSEPGGIEVVDAAQLDRHYAVNLRAATLLCAEFVRAHRAGRPGRIVNVTSGQGHEPMPSEIAYVVTKAGLDALTLSLAAALASLGITVNAIDPGPTDTGWMPPDLRRELEAHAPMGRVGVPLDAARLVRFLASDEAGWITGQIIRSRGGL